MATMKPGTMRDLTRYVMENKYHPYKNPNGILDMGSSMNEIMMDEMSSFTKETFLKHYIPQEGESIQNSFIQNHSATDTA